MVRSFAVIVVGVIRQAFDEGFPPPEVFVVVLEPDLREHFYGVFVFPWNLGDDVHFSSSSLFLVDLDVVGEEWQFAEAAGPELRHPRRIYIIGKKILGFCILKLVLA